MARPQWNWMNPIAADRSLVQNAFDSQNRGLSTLAQGVKDFGTAVRDQNTQNILTEAMGIQNLEDLEVGRQGVLASLAAAGKGADATKVMAALQQQERSLYDRQNSINQLQDRAFREADLAAMRDPNILQKALGGDITSLQAIATMHDPSNLINTYVSGRNHKESNDRDTRDYNDRVEERRYRRTQDAISNNLRLEEANLRYAQATNPDPLGQTTTYVDNGDGTYTEIVTENPSLGDTAKGIAALRKPDGSLDFGKLATATQPSAGTGGRGNNSSSGYSPSIQTTVASNLQSLAKNLTSGDFGKALARTGLSGNNKVKAMAAIESGAGGMDTHSGQAVGPMQLNTRYHKGDAVTNIDANVRTGAKEIARLDKKYGGNTDAIAIAYNGGDNAADVAYKAWNAAGKRGRVADYIPSTYKANGKTKQYDVAQMRNHAYKYDLALSYLNKESNKRTGGKSAAPAAAPLALGNGALARAQQGFSNTLRGTELNENAKARTDGSSVHKNGLDMFLEDQKIDKNGGLLSRVVSDSQSVYSTLSSNPAYVNLPAKDQKDILTKALAYNKNNQGWLGLNKSGDTQNLRTNKEIQNLIQSKRDAHEEANFKNLRAAATKLIEDESKRKNRKGSLPTIDQAMRMISPSVYASMKQKDKMVKSPFQ